MVTGSTILANNSIKIYDRTRTQLRLLAFNLLRALVAKPRGTPHVSTVPYVVQVVQVFCICASVLYLQVFCICGSVLYLCKCFVFVEVYCICASVLYLCKCFVFVQVFSICVSVFYLWECFLFVGVFCDLYKCFVICTSVL